jgi:hypothetical protein
MSADKLAAVLTAHANKPGFLPYEDGSDVAVDKKKILKNTDMWNELLKECRELQEPLSFKKDMVQAALRTVLASKDWQLSEDEAKDWVATVAVRICTQARHIGQAMLKTYKWAAVFTAGGNDEGEKDSNDEGEKEDHADEPGLGSGGSEQVKFPAYSVGWDTELLKAWRCEKGKSRKYAVGNRFSKEFEAEVCYWSDDFEAVVDKGDAEIANKSVCLFMGKLDGDTVKVVLVKRQPLNFYAIFIGKQQACQSRADAVGSTNDTIAMMNGLAEQYVNKTANKIELKKLRDTFVTKYNTEQGKDEKRKAKAASAKRPAANVEPAMKKVKVEKGTPSSSSMASIQIWPDDLEPF